MIRVVARNKNKYLGSTIAKDAVWGKLSTSIWSSYIPSPLAGEG